MALTIHDYLHTAAADGYTPSSTAVNAYVAAASFNSGVFYVGQLRSFDVQVTCPSTGSPVGTITLQGSNDFGRLHDMRGDDGVSHWFDLKFDDESGAPVTAQTLNGASTLVFEELNCTYRWLRMVYTRTSGTCTMTAIVQGKGWK